MPCPHSLVMNFWKRVRYTHPHNIIWFWYHTAQLAETWCDLSMQANSYYNYEDVIDSDEELDLVSMVDDSLSEGPSSV